MVNIGQHFIKYLHDKGLQKVLVKFPANVRDLHKHWHILGYYIIRAIDCHGLHPPYETDNQVIFSLSGLRAHWSELRITVQDTIMYSLAF